MGYRDPNEALRAENESLQQQLRAAQEAENESLRQQLRDAQERLEAARAGAPTSAATSAAADDSGQRWAMGMRCLGGVALMLPFLLMTAVCEHRVAPRRHAPAVASASMIAAPAAQLVEVPRPYVSHACQNRVAPSPGFEGFTRSLERSARVVESDNVDGVAAGTPCTVRVVPVSMQDFNCHVEVVCNGRTLYGTLPTGYAHCDVEGASVLGAQDADHSGQDGDPAINVDLAGNRAVVTDSVAGRPTRVRLALDVPPALD
jgi:hypothetical protein